VPGKWQQQHAALRIAQQHAGLEARLRANTAYVSIPWTARPARLTNCVSQTTSGEAV
jgi:hypothetical protein